MTMTIAMTTQGRFIVTSLFLVLRKIIGTHPCTMAFLELLTTCSWNDSTVITPMTGTDKRRHHHQ